MDVDLLVVWMKSASDECINCGCREEAHPIPECKEFKKMTASKSASEVARELLGKIRDEQISWEAVADALTAYAKEQIIEARKKWEMERCQ